MTSPSGPDQAAGSVGEAEQTPLFVFRLAERWFGLPPEQVIAVCEDDLPRTRVPLAPAHLEGVVNYRGRALGLVDPRALLGLEERVPNRRLLVVRAGDLEAGLLSPEVRGVIWVPEGAVRVPGTSTRYARGLLDLPQGLTRVLNLGRLLRDATQRP